MRYSHYSQSRRWQSQNFHKPAQLSNMHPVRCHFVAQSLAILKGHVIGCQVTVQIFCQQLKRKPREWVLGNVDDISERLHGYFFAK